MHKHQIKNISLSDMQNLATKLAGKLNAGDCIALNGDLGAGKSTMARFIIQSLVGDVGVPSPTFTLVQTYNGENFDIWHLDLYRLETPEQTLELGVDEAFSNAVCLIEWAEKGVGFLPNDIMHINITNGDNDDCRNIEFVGNKWATKGITDD